MIVRLVIGSIGALAATAVVLAVTVGTEAGIMCELPALVLGGTLICQRGQMSARRAFIHGWHAGYHEARLTDCIVTADAPCDVYMLSERRWTSA